MRESFAMFFCFERTFLRFFFEGFEVDVSADGGEGEDEGSSSAALLAAASFSRSFFPSFFFLEDAPEVVGGVVDAGAVILGEV